MVYLDHKYTVYYSNNKFKKSNNELLKKEKLLNENRKQLN